MNTYPWINIDEYNRIGINLQPNRIEMDKEIKEKFLDEVVKRGLSLRKTSYILKVAYTTLHRSVQEESPLSTMMKKRMEAFIKGII